MCQSRVQGKGVKVLAVNSYSMHARQSPAKYCSVDLDMDHQYTGWDKRVSVSYVLRVTITLSASAVCL